MSARTSVLPGPLGLAPSFGFGDRLGLATPGHLAALQRDGGPIRPVFAQQSIREMARTGRTPQQVMDDAATALTAERFDRPWGADADHLKTEQDVEATARAGFVFFTIDPSDYVDQQADGYEPDSLAERFDQVRDQAGWVEQYVGQRIDVPGGPTIEFDRLTVHRAAVKYGRAINHTLRMADCIASLCAELGREYEIEISVDETPQPTSLAEHYVIAEQLLRAGVKLVSLAPRFIGDFEKAVDYKGDVAAFERSLADHAAIARHLGPYKLSLHSGSDKLSIYGRLARLTGGLFHVKTAGTSYLEALRVVARHDGGLFRRIVEFSRQHYQRDRASYHVSAELRQVPGPEQAGGVAELERLYLGRWAEVPPGSGFTEPGRQILHCTFGSVLTDARLGPELRNLLATHRDTYRAVLCEHFSRHLAALRGL